LESNTTKSVSDTDVKSFLKRFSDYFADVDPDAVKYFEDICFKEFYRYKFKDVFIDNLENIQVGHSYA
jgi:hypothetical protein